MRIIIFLSLMTIVFSQESNSKSKQIDMSISLKAIKIGIDVESQWRTEVGDSDFGQGDSAFSLDDGISLGVEVNLNNKFEAGLEILPETNTNSSIFGTVGAVSHWSLYGLYNLYSDENVSLKPKVGFSTFTFNPKNDGGPGDDATSSGGLMYGFQIEYRNVIHASYTRHYGEWYFEDESDEKFSTRTSRFTISYAYNL